MLPKNRDIEIPLLKALEDMGGSGVTSDVYPRVRKFFPQLSDADVAELLPSGGNKWINRIQWVRQQHLISRGEMESPERGRWAITEKGRLRLGGVEKGEPALPQPEDAANLEEVVEEYAAAFRDKVLQKLQDLTPAQFERFAGVLLSAYGFVDVKVTGKTNDGGIDGHGKLRVGLATMDVVYNMRVGPIEDTAKRSEILKKLREKVREAGFKEIKAKKLDGREGWNRISATDTIVNWGEDDELEPAVIQEAVKKLLDDIFPKLEKLAPVLKNARDNLQGM